MCPYTLPRILFTTPFVHGLLVRDDRPIRGFLRIPDRATKPPITKPLFSRVDNGTRTRDRVPFWGFLKLGHIAPCPCVERFRNWRQRVHHDLKVAEIRPSG